MQDKVLTSTFGEQRWGFPHPGIDIGGGEQPVYPAEAGELVYYAEENGGMGMLPSGLGSFAVIEHERKLRTLYGHLEPGSIATGSIKLDTTDILARVGSSGMTVGPRLHFQVIDGEFDQYVNPLIILPPLKDTTRPVLEAVYILKDRQLVELLDTSTVSSGSYELLLSLYDPSEYLRYFRPMNPYRIQVFMNGEQVAHMSFKALQPKDGAVFLIESDDADGDEIYYDEHIMRMGTVQFPPGDMILEVLAEDIYRNSMTVELRIRVID